MTQLFQRDKPIKLVELDREYEKKITQELSVKDKANTPIVKADETEEQPTDLSQVLGNLTGGSETTATDVIKELGVADENLPMKTILPHPGAFTAVQILADFNTLIGMENVTEALEEFAEWHYKHLCSHKGKRAEQQFGALTQVKQEEFQLEKEAKGLLRR